MVITKYTFWLKAGAVFQLLTAVFHALSFVSKPQSQEMTPSGSYWT